jgi:hypothetical protein
MLHALGWTQGLSQQLAHTRILQLGVEIVLRFEYVWVDQNSTAKL